MRTAERVTQTAESAKKLDAKDIKAVAACYQLVRAYLQASAKASPGH
jgi:hypothetical protein